MSDEKHERPAVVSLWAPWLRWQDGMVAETLFGEVVVLNVDDDGTPLVWFDVMTGSLINGALRHRVDWDMDDNRPDPTHPGTLAALAEQIAVVVQTARNWLPGDVGEHQARALVWMWNGFNSGWLEIEERAERLATLIERVNAWKAVHAAPELEQDKPCPDCDGTDFDGDGMCMTTGCSSKDPKPHRI